MNRQLVSLTVAAILFAYDATVFFCGQGAAALRTDSTRQTEITAQLGEDEIALTEEAYICGHIAATLPADAGEEAIKALVVVLRTRLYSDQTEDSNADKTMQIEPSAYRMESACIQKMGLCTYLSFRARITAAIEATSGQTLRDANGAYIEAAYHGVSAGTTRSGGADFPYLCAKESRADISCAQYLTSYRFDVQTLTALYPEISADAWAQLTTVNEADSFYVKEVQVGGQTIDGTQFCERLSLCSPAFFAKWQEDGLQIVCRGQGHGFGLSCFGAQDMAASGSDYAAILAYYYENTVLTAE